MTATEGQKQTFQLSPDCSIGELKSLVDATLHIPVEEQTISCSANPHDDDDGDILKDDACSLYGAGLQHGCHLHVSYAVGGTRKCPFCDRCGMSGATVCMHVHSDHLEQVFAFELSRRFEARSGASDAKVGKIEEEVLRMQREIGSVREELSTTREELSVTKGELSKVQDELLSTKKQLCEVERKVNDIPVWVLEVLETIESISFCEQNANGDTILTLAAERAYVEAVKYLRDILDDDDFNHSNHQGGTPLLVEAQNGRLEVLQYLMTLPSIEINYQDTFGNTSFHFAAFYGHFEVLKYLNSLSSFDVNNADSDGRTSFYSAASEGHLETVQ